MKVGIAVTSPGAAAIAEIRLTPRQAPPGSQPADRVAQASAPKPIGSLLPQVLAQYGLARAALPPSQIDLWA